MRCAALEVCLQHWNFFFFDLRHYYIRTSTVFINMLLTLLFGPSNLYISFQINPSSNFTPLPCNDNIQTSAEGGRSISLNPCVDVAW